MTTEELLDLTRKWERGEMGDEEYVRAVWTDILWTMGPNPWTLRISYPRYFDGTQNECWHTAAEFTRDRIEEVRMLEREIGFLKKCANWYGEQSALSLRMGLRDSAGGEAREQCTSLRTLMRLDALLAEAKKGMR